MSLAQFQAFEKAVTREIGVALSGNLVPDVLRGDGRYGSAVAGGIGKWTVHVFGIALRVGGGWGRRGTMYVFGVSGSSLPDVLRGDGR
jgi:hypothetical protein